MAITSITDAQAPAFRLDRRLKKGEEVTISEAGKPVANLVPVEL